MCRGGASGTVLTGAINKAGTASSFGSYATAPGANAHTIANSKVTLGTIVAGGRLGICKDAYGRGSMGAPGWLPDIGYVPVPSQYYGHMSSGLTKVFDWLGLRGPYDFAPYSAGIAAINKRGVGYAGCGQLYVEVRSSSDANTIELRQLYYDLLTHRPGGMGYGAGGGGTFHFTDMYQQVTDNSAGGNSGGVTEAAITLPSSAAIAVTVGKGGESVTQTYASRPMYSGEGANGCVAVFW